MLFVGDDWAEAHHDIEIVDDQGRRLARRRLPEGVAGWPRCTRWSRTIWRRGPAEAGTEVLIGIETDRGPWVQALIAAGYTVYAINPLQVARYRERHGTSGAKCDPGDAHVLAEIVRLDRAHHRPRRRGLASWPSRSRCWPGRTRSMIWSRQRQANTLRSMLRECYPAALAAFGDDLAGRDALAVLALAPDPEQGRRLTLAKVEAAAAGRTATQPAGHRRGDPGRAARPAAAGQPGVVRRLRRRVRALVAVMASPGRPDQVLKAQVEAGFGQHPDAEIYLSQPGLGPILGARVLAEFGDDPDRYADARARKNYAGMAPITRASGTRRVVLARHARNRRLADALYQQAFAALSSSPGARAYYDTHRARGATHHQALRALANRLVGILHGCLRHHTPTTRTPPGSTKPHPTATPLDALEPWDV